MMMRNSSFTIADFKKASNNCLYNNDVFDVKNKNKGIKIVVEGYEDICFYKGYLKKVYGDFGNITFLCVNEGKSDVIKYARAKRKGNYKYIVDLDYDDKEKLMSLGTIVTSGYSMENFFFYFTENNNNLRRLIYRICQDYGWMSNSGDMLLKMVEVNLEKYKENHLIYYAYMKSLLECRKINSIEMKNAGYDEYQEIIDKELADLPEYERNKMISRIEKNKSIINDANYMLIRGHDLFDYLLILLKKSEYIDASKITKEYIYSLAEFLYIPEDFKNQLS